MEKRLIIAFEVTVAVISIFSPLLGVSGGTGERYQIHGLHVITTPETTPQNDDLGALADRQCLQ